MPMDIFSKEGPKRGTEKWWESQITKAERYRYNNAFEADWTRIGRWYRNDWDNPLEPHFNLIYMLVQSLIPALMYRRPGITNSPRLPQYLPWAQFFDGIDNWLIDEMDVAEIAKEAILYAFLYNMGAIQLGYDFPDDIQSLAAGEKIVFGPVEGTVDRSRKQNQPWLDIIPPDRLIVAPGTINQRSCPWFAKLVTLQTEVVKKLPGFNSRKVGSTHVPKQIESYKANEYLRDAQGDEEYTSFWEIHDAYTGDMLAMDTDGNMIMSPVKDPLQLDGLPVEFLVFNKNMDSIWGTPDSLYVQTQMMEGNECRQMGMLQRRAALLKMLVASDAMSKEDIEEFLHGDPMAMLRIELPHGRKLNEVIFPVQPHVQMEYFEVQKSHLNDAQLITGIGPNHLGQFASGRKTKYETQVVEENNMLRTGVRRQELADIIGKLFGKVNQLVTKYWTAPVVARVVGVNGAMAWVQGRPSEMEEIRAQLVTKVNVESMTPVSRERKKQEMVELMQVLSQFQGVNPFPMLQTFLSSFDFVDVANTLPQQAGGTMGINDFATQQQEMAQSPQLGQQLQSNLGGLSRLIGGLPSIGGN